MKLFDWHGHGKLLFAIWILCLLAFVHLDPKCFNMQLNRLCFCSRFKILRSGTTAPEKVGSERNVENTRLNVLNMSLTSDCPSTCSQGFEYKPSKNPPGDQERFDYAKQPKAVANAPRRKLSMDQGWQSTQNVWPYFFSQTQNNCWASAFPYLCAGKLYPQWYITANKGLFWAMSKISAVIKLNVSLHHFPYCFFHHVRGIGSTQLGNALGKTVLFFIMFFDCFVLSPAVSL